MISSTARRVSEIRSTSGSSIWPLAWQKFRMVLAAPLELLLTTWYFRFTAVLLFGLGTPIRGLSRNGVKNYSKGPCVTFLE